MTELVIRVNRELTEARETEKDVFQYFYDRGRQWWRTRPDRAIMADHLVIVDAKNEVVVIGKIEGVKKDISRPDGRISIEMQPERSNEWVGRIIDRGQSRNPVTYVDKLKELHSAANTTN